MKQATLHIILLLLCESVCAQVIFPETLDWPHPRLISADVDHSYLKQQIQDNSEVKLDYEGFKGRIDGYVNQHVTDPQWMVSRLQMYWKTHSTDAFIKGGIYSHAEGYAPVPTVRFSGARDPTTNYLKPKLEDIKPYKN